MPSNVSAYGTTVANALQLQSTTASTNSTTGALVVSGGVGIGGNLNVTGTITGGSITYASTSTGTITVTDTPGTTFQVDSVEECSAALTGSAIFKGGVYVAKNLRVDGTLTAGGITYSSTSTGTLNVTDSTGTTLDVDSTQASTSKTTGCAIFGGGVGIAGAIHADSQTLYSTTQSSSTSTGALVVPGGAGVGGNIYAGGTLTAGTVTSNGDVNNKGFDFKLGAGDQSTRGNSGESRALVKVAGDPIAIINPRLCLNFENDFSGGVLVDSNMVVNGNLTAQNITGSGTTSLNILSVSNDSIFNGITVNGDSILNGLTVSGTSTLNGLTVNGSSTFTGITSTGTSTFSAVTVNGNSQFSGVTVNSQFVANSAVTLNAQAVANSGMTIAGAVGQSALTIAGEVGFSALTIKFGGTDVFNITEGSTTVNNFVSETINVTNNYTINGTPVISDNGGNIEIAAAAITTTGNQNTDILNATTSVDTPVLAIGGTTTVTTDLGTVKVGQDATPMDLVGSSIGASSFDFKLGYGDQVTRGDSGESRALVKEAGPVSGSKLTINYNGDFTAGVQVDSNLNASGDLASIANVVAGGYFSGPEYKIAGYRALTKTDSPLKLILNTGGDFTGGVQVDSNLNASGDLASIANVVAGGYFSGPEYQILGDSVLGLSSGDIYVGNASYDVNLVGAVNVDGYDLRLAKGNTGRGDSGESRALVKWANNMLIINFENDFTGGVEVQSALHSVGAVTGDSSLTMDGNITGANFKTDNVPFTPKIVIYNSGVPFSETPVITNAGVTWASIGEEVRLSLNVNWQIDVSFGIGALFRCHLNLNPMFSALGKGSNLGLKIPVDLFVSDVIPVNVSKTWKVMGVIFINVANGNTESVLVIYERDKLSFPTATPYQTTQITDEYLFSGSNLNDLKRISMSCTFNKAILS